jgi:broad specificity phosphatase PhoE
MNSIDFMTHPDVPINPAVHVTQWRMSTNAFFAKPRGSMRGWETAADTQRRIVAAITTVHHDTPAGQDIAIVSHGAAGAMLLCHLRTCPISRTQDQPGTAGGNSYHFDRQTLQLHHGERPIEALAAT